MSYTTEIKNEIAINNKDYRKPEVLAELSGFKIILTSENINIINRINDCIKKNYNIEGTIKTIDNLNFSKKDLYELTIIDNDHNILKDIGYLDDNDKYLDNPPSYILDDLETVKAYLKGAFFCTGSINDPKTSRYHLELLINKPEEAVFIQRLLNTYDLNAKILNREKGYMIYIKEADKISDFIKILDATKAVLYYENIRVYRDEKNMTNRLNNCEQANIDKIISTATRQLDDMNMTNRLNNCEQANIDKIISTATRQLDDIKVLEDTASISLLDDKCQELVRYRKEYPETSLQELANIISNDTKKKITKSGLNHRFRKITDLAEKIKKNLKENSKV